MVMPIVDIAERLGVSNPVLRKAANYLSDQGYVTKEKYGTITLTDRGEMFPERSTPIIK